MIDTKLKNPKEDKLALSSFKKYLEGLPNKINDGKPIVFIIDELDRCRPDFALELIEQIKHLFSVPKITFLLVTNRVQLEEIIKSKYGNGINASLYLQKFVNIWLKLPRNISLDYAYHDDGKRYLEYLLENLSSHSDENINKNELTIRFFRELVEDNKVSFREIERMLSSYSILHNFFDSAYIDEYQLGLAFVSYLNIFHYKILLDICNNTYLLSEILSIVRKITKDDEKLKEYIVMDLGTVDEINSFLEITVNSNSWRRHESKIIVIGKRLLELGK